ncbi:MAG: hypothetical protein EXQ88_00630 [Alphaproteobacteria bacterium]|nr:hypothetical protein [Alphaproteobacteria bacterium]
MSSTRTYPAGAALALTIALGVTAPALADFDRDRHWTPGPPPQAWQPHHPPADGYYRNAPGWVWVCGHHACGWLRDTRRYAPPPHYAQPYPRHRLPPIAWQPPLGSIYWELHFW